MPRTAKKRGRPRPPQMEYFIFEFKEWSPDYHISVNHDRYEHVAYSEYVKIEAKACCVFPEKLAGRMARIDIVGRRDHMHPAIMNREPDWRPNCVGALVLPPSGGDFYLTVPLENMAFLLTAFAQGMFRYISLWGPQLSRGKSLCTSVQLLPTIDLNDY